MSLDGAFLHLVKTELISKNLIGGRIDKIHQPSKDEIVISLRCGGGTEKLLISANTACARVCLTEEVQDNPKAPPMFCMLLRKHLNNGRLVAISQDGLERIINFDFVSMNEIGDMVNLRLAVEIMGRFSNIILLIEKEEGYRVVDSIKRVTDDISSVRRILPNILYELPPRDERLNLLDLNENEIIPRLKSLGDIKLQKALLQVFEGICPIFARECTFYAARDCDALVSEIDEDRLLFFIQKAKTAVTENPQFVIVCELSGKPKDFTFINIEQYANEMLVKKYETASQLLQKFYGERASTDRMKQRSNDILKNIMNIYSRISKKLELQKIELTECKEREQFRVWGDLVNANIFRIEKGQNEVIVDNYFTGEKETIKLDIRLTPAQNAQKYYSEYKKLDTAERMLTKLILSGEKELLYVDSVFDSASRASSENELSEIREELIETGYMRKISGGKKIQKTKSLPPLKFVSIDGTEILAGRNNIQNDKLTLKTASPEDIWLHTQNIPGSHVIICCRGKEPSDSTLVEAAEIAAYCSKARNSSKVPVDYTKVKYVKKPNGSKPGMVIFTNNKTLLVNPNEEKYENLKA